MTAPCPSQSTAAAVATEALQFCGPSTFASISVKFCYVKYDGRYRAITVALLIMPSVLMQTLRSDHITTLPATSRYQASRRSACHHINALLLEHHQTR